jgi:glycosyltransferase involved in cell wall biosynthesis
LSKSNELEDVREISLTVFVPVYNEERYLEATLRSVEQSANHYEEIKGKIKVVISNNGSSDHSSEIISIFLKRNPFWQIRNSQVMLSGDIHFNNLIHSCETEYICIVGAHDLVSKSYFYALEEQLSQNLKSPLCFSNEYLDKKGSGQFANQVDFKYKFSTNEIERFWQSIFYLSNATCIQGVIRTELLKRIDAYDSKVSDLVWLHGLLANGPFLYNNKAAYIRMHPVRPQNFMNPKVRKLSSNKIDMEIAILKSWTPDNLNAIFTKFARVAIRCKFNQRILWKFVFRMARKISSIVIVPPSRALITSENQEPYSNILAL